MRRMIVTNLTLCLLNDDEIQISSLRTTFFVLTSNGKMYTNAELPLADLYRLFAEDRVFSLWVPDYPRFVMGEYDEELEIVDDLLIFPQGIAHIEADACSVEV